MKVLLNTPIGGGAALLNAFLAEDSADELIFNCTPHLRSSELHVNLAKEGAKALELLSCRELGSCIEQLEYELKDR